jgi:WD40 repeat protein
MDTSPSSTRNPHQWSQRTSLTRWQCGRYPGRMILRWAVGRDAAVWLWLTIPVVIFWLGRPPDSLARYPRGNEDRRRREGRRSSCNPAGAPELGAVGSCGTRRQIARISVSDSLFRSPGHPEAQNSAEGRSGADRQVRLWDIAQRTSVFSTTTAAPVWALDWQPANVASGSLGVGKMFATGGDEKKVMIYRAAGSV